MLLASRANCCDPSESIDAYSLGAVCDIHSCMRTYRIRSCTWSLSSPRYLSPQLVVVLLALAMLEDLCTSGVSSCFFVLRWPLLTEAGRNKDGPVP